MKHILLVLTLLLSAVGHAADGTFTAPTYSFAEFTPPYGTTFPSTCTPPKFFVKTDATTAAQLYVCTATNTWTQQVGTGGGGGVTNPLVLTNGVDTLTLNATGSYSGSITVPYSLDLIYGNGGMIGIFGTNTQGSTPLDRSPNGNNLWRTGMHLGRHCGQIASAPSATFGSCGLSFEIHANDDATQTLNLTGQNAYPQATTNTTGGNTLIAAGIGRRFVTISNYATLGGKVITVSVNGIVTTLTEGVNWTAATSNAATASSLSTALNAIPGVDIVLSSNVVYVKPVYSSAAVGPVFNMTLTSNAADAVVTQGADGKIRIGTTAIPAINPAAFSATHYIEILDGENNLVRMPVSNVAW